MASSDTGNPAGDGAEGSDPNAETDGTDAANETGGQEETTTTEEETKDPAADVKAQLKEMRAEFDRLKAENANLIKQSRKHEDRAKANAQAAAELEQIRTKDLPEHEKALAEARKQGKAEATMEFGQKLARAEFRAATVGRLDDAKLTVLLDGLNLARFVDDEGEADRDAIVAYVNSILPPAAPAVPTEDEEPAPTPKRKSGQPAETNGEDIGQGAGRGAAPTALNSDQLQAALERAVGLRK